MGMTLEGIEARKNYYREYRARNKERIKAQRREWSRKNRSRIKECNERYWQTKAGKQNIRMPWSAYGIDEARLEELTALARSGKYDALVLSSAIKADRLAAGHIILAVMKNLSYEHIEFDDRLGRCPVGRTNFYGVRRLFFHYFDIALKELQESSVEVQNG